MTEVRPRALDLFCGGGGATRGLQLAGFHVTGVDIKPQPRYCGDAFVQGDALRPPFDLSSFNFIWASPPCQAYSQISVRYEGKGGARDARPDHIPAVRAMLRASGVPYVIENVNGARYELETPFRLTGEMFGLGVHRPRWFETSFYVLSPTAPTKQPNPIAVYGEMNGRRLWTRTDGTELRAPKTLEPAALAMGIDWLDWDTLREAIPPAYSEFIGRAALAHLEQRAAA